MRCRCVEVDQIDTTMLLHPFIMVLKSPTVTGPIVESVLTALDTFFQSGIITEESMHIRSSISILLEAVARCRFEATDRSQDEVVLVHMLELLRSTISLPIGNILSDSDIWCIFDTVFVNSQEVVAWRQWHVGGVFAVAAEGCGACASRHHDHHLPSLFGVVFAASPPRAASSQPQDYGYAGEASAQHAHRIDREG